jgi:hypothetical protein
VRRPCSPFLCHPRQVGEKQELLLLLLLLLVLVTL